MNAQKDSRPSPQSRAEQHKEAEICSEVDNDGKSHNYPQKANHTGPPNTVTMQNSMKASKRMFIAYLSWPQSVLLDLL